MLTRGKVPIIRDETGARMFKVCGCGARFPVEINRRGQMTSRMLCDNCRLRRLRRKCEELPNTEGLPRCEDCGALEGIEWGSATFLDGNGRCPACAEWHLKAMEREARDRAGYVFRGGIWVYGNGRRPPAPALPRPPAPRPPAPIVTPARKRYADEGYLTQAVARMLGMTRGAVRHLAAIGVIATWKDEKGLILYDRRMVDALAVAKARAS
jgi:hypothetical protein